MNNLPVGAIIPFFLKPSEIKALAPIWLPADGRRVDDRLSPLNGQNLPNLIDRTILGASSDLDTVPTDRTTQGGTLDIELNGLIDDNHSTTGAEQDVTANGERYVKGEGQPHVHRINSIPVKVGGQMNRQPFRRLVYLVLVRKSEQPE